MKGCVAATVVLCVVVLAVAVNAVYVHHVSDRLLGQLDELPELPDPAATPAQIREVKDYLGRHLSGLSLSINYTLPDRIAETIAMLEASARTGDGLQYAATLALLRDLCEDLTRAERFHLENIF